MLASRQPAAVGSGHGVYGDEGPRFRGYLELCDSPWDGQVICVGTERRVQFGMGWAWLPRVWKPVDKLLQQR